MTEEVKVYRHHFRQLGYCSKGGRAFFNKHGWDWFDFIKNGRSAKDFEQTGDAQAIRVAGLARGR